MAYLLLLDVITFVSSQHTAHTKSKCYFAKKKISGIQKLIRLRIWFGKFN